MNFDLSTIGTLCIDEVTGFEIGLKRVAQLDKVVQCFHLAMDISLA